MVQSPISSTQPLRADTCSLLSTQTATPLCRVTSLWSRRGKLIQSSSRASLRVLFAESFTGKCPPRYHSMSLLPVHSVRCSSAFHSRSIVIGDHSQHSQSHRRAAFSEPLAGSLSFQPPQSEQQRLREFSPRTPSKLQTHCLLLIAVTHFTSGLSWYEPMDTAHCWHVSPRFSDGSSVAQRTLSVWRHFTRWVAIALHGQSHRTHPHLPAQGPRYRHQAVPRDAQGQSGDPIKTLPFVRDASARPDNRVRQSLGLISPSALTV